MGPSGRFCNHIIVVACGSRAPPVFVAGSITLRLESRISGIGSVGPSWGQRSGTPGHVRGCGQTRLATTMATIPTIIFTMISVRDSSTTTTAPKSTVYHRKVDRKAFIYM